MAKAEALAAVESVWGLAGVLAGLVQALEEAVAALEEAWGLALLSWPTWSRLRWV
jgi:hypothetical protein